MSRSDFAGSVADNYGRYRRDLPAELAARIGAMVDPAPGELICDLGCGTGQLSAPLAAHVCPVIGVDPEPDMLDGLRRRRLDRVEPVAGSDADLPELAARYGPFAAVTIGNALHWMNEAAVIAASFDAVRPGGGLAVVTQGPPLWLADTEWSRALRSILESHFGPLSATCGTDQHTLQARIALIRERFGRVDLIEQTLSFRVDADWVVGHLRSAMSHGKEPPEFEQTVRAALGGFDELIEQSEITIILGTR